jgi:glycosyltransferase involved in cell wall biosynthesis
MQLVNILNIIFNIENCNCSYSFFNHFDKTKQINNFNNVMPISISIPFYNCERFLPDAIRSVFAQTYQDWELILIDDGSTDRSLEITRSIDDPRVRVLSDGKNLRQATRRNQANKLAKYDLIAVMDADDIMFSKRLAIQQACFVDQKIQMVSSGICKITDNNQIRSLQNCSEKYDITLKGFLQYKHHLMHPAVMARKQWFLDHPYDTNILHGDDFELFLRCTLDRSLTNSTVKIVDEPLLFYREDSLQTLKKLKIGQRDIRYSFAKHSLNLGWKTDITYSLLWKLRDYISSFKLSIILNHNRCCNVLAIARSWWFV